MYEWLEGAQLGYSPQEEEEAWALLQQLRDLQQQRRAAQQRPDAAQQPEAAQQQQPAAAALSSASEP